MKLHDRIATKPHTKEYRHGDRYGIIVRMPMVKNGRVSVQMDKSNNVIRFIPDDIEAC